uniref:Uncharacterized protein n=1 Tax=Nicotiana tabacum TaxID=4097 RepID=A0A1S3XIB2_TOBAC|nr:PREDICTED: uncharacterized protein LOC107765453 [Nicotiana tabacum]
MAAAARRGCCCVLSLLLLPVASLLPALVLLPAASSSSPPCCRAANVSAVWLLLLQFPSSPNAPPSSFVYCLSFRADSSHFDAIIVSGQICFWSSSSSLRSGTLL